MERIKKIFLRVHVILWILFSLLIALQTTQETVYWFKLTVAILLTSLYVFYSHFFLLTHYSGKKKKGAYFLALAWIILSGPLMYILLHYKKLNTPDLFFEYYMVSLISIILPFIFLGWLARITENLVLNTFKKEQLEKQAVEAELYYLKSQINPHFLFNTLNNIHTLVYKQAPAAPEAVMRLSSLMRYMIYESNSTTVPLSTEMKYLSDYMALQQLRYKNSPIVNFEVEGDIENCHIAPLLFIHLLENAYKHSPARLESGAINLTISVKENTLTFKVENPREKKIANGLEEPGGIGLPNVQKRLQLLYPDQHRLDIKKTEDVFTVEMNITNLHTQVHERKAHLLYN
ncbi:histidine kinase [Antarcticibacterium sp. 1MA-6-2]|uniref:sensor histidine kinase n=1 Tax=Antarcticibacterium sp. 1MA-6-2 TaxID=2908210 RepID=UPI001F246C9A|nr:histidine kinase [Antarcticibacterium sp. 1MA-6-2]UJH91662.1 histidine kinase [Antarcticibacterium sp. 1MA-6-2]